MKSVRYPPIRYPNRPADSADPPMTAKPSRPPALVFDRAHMVADTIAMVLDGEGYAAHAAVTYRDAKRAFQALPDLSLMVIHADTPGERRGSML